MARQVKECRVCGSELPSGNRTFCSNMCREVWNEMMYEKKRPGPDYGSWTISRLMGEE